MQLYFIRHGQSENNALWAQSGSDDNRNEDPDLTALGEAQAERTAAYIRDYHNPAWKEAWDPRNEGGFKLTHIYCSLMLRAVRTGSAIASALGLPLLAWEDLHETGGIFLENLDTGERVGLPGKDRNYFALHYPHLHMPDTINPTGWWNRPFEERPLRHERAARVLALLLERHDGTTDRVGIITHGGFYNLMIKSILGIDLESPAWFNILNCAITRVDFGTEISVAYTNRSDHLPPRLLT